MNEPGGSDLLEIISKAASSAIDSPPRGNMGYRDEAYDMPEILAAIGGILDDRVSRMRRESIDPDYISVLNALAGSIHELGSRATTLGDYFDEAHRERVADLTSGENPAGWDTGMNGIG